MKINSELGYKPVFWIDDWLSFWKDVKLVPLWNPKSKENKMCLCTGMLYDPKESKIPPNTL
jgi:hypothetical protein